MVVRPSKMQLMYREYKLVCVN